MVEALGREDVKKLREGPGGPHDAEGCQEHVPACQQAPQLERRPEIEKFVTADETFDHICISCHVATTYLILWKNFLIYKLLKKMVGENCFQKSYW